MNFRLSQERASSGASMKFLRS